MNISRRFFLGGAISLVAASTFVTSPFTANMPTIHGNGIDDDTSGLGSLFRNEPVIFSKDKIGVDSHQGITIHKGIFRISQTIGIPKDAKIKIERALFQGDELKIDQPFFKCALGFDDYQLCDNRSLIFETKAGYKSSLFVFADNDYEI